VGEVGEVGTGGLDAAGEHYGGCDEDYGCYQAKGAAGTERGEAGNDDVGLKSSGTLTWAIMMASRWVIAENKVTLPFSSVHAPRSTLPSSAIFHPPPELSFLECAKSHAPVFLSISSSSIPAGAFRITDWPGQR
jgi:hypothetical protein